jgi:hypothetical protein
MLREMKASEYPRAGPTGSEDGARDQILDLARPALNPLPKTGPCDGAQPETRALQSVVKPQANTNHGVRHELSF